MKNKNAILALLKKDFLLELRQQYTLYGIILYVVTTIFVVYLSMGQPDDQVWNGLFWVIQLFVCVNAVAKSFLQEGSGRMLYFYSITSAQNFVLAKLIFNLVLMLAMSLLSLAVFTLLLGNPLTHALVFTGIVCLGGMSISLVFTFLAAIAAKAQQNAATTHENFSYRLFVCYTRRLYTNGCNASWARYFSSCPSANFISFFMERLIAL